MATEFWVNVGTDDGLLPDGTKPLPSSGGNFGHFSWENHLYVIEVYSVVCFCKSQMKF